MKDEEIYNIFNTEKMLGRPAQVSIDTHSGLAGIAYWINHRMGVNVEKRSPVVVRMKEMIDELYAEGRNTSMSDAELTELYAKASE